jgi:hypothetical protein
MPALPPFLAALGMTLAAVAAADDAPAPREVRDLHYGEVLFHFYQEDYFNALIRLLAARSQERVEHHAAEAELLLGGMYLSYGQHQEAGSIFARLLDGDVSEPVRDRAWFYLAKIRYQRGYLAEAEQALGGIRGVLDPRLEAERRLLHAQILLSAGRYDEAIAVLDRWQGPANWAGYARFNLGVALVRSGRLEEGARQLGEVGVLRAQSEELKSLRDKANVALGYAWLQGDRPDLARPALERVRLEGVYSNTALLGAGWADSAEQRFRDALVPWTELGGRDPLDPAVQEALLAVPFAFGRLDADGQALEHYRRAIDMFGEEATRLGESVQRAGQFVDTLVDGDGGGDMGWFWSLDALPDVRESRYLQFLLAQHEFQEGLKAYRDLRWLGRNLAGWAASLDSFRAMLAAREQAYAQRLPLIEKSLDAVDLEAMVAGQLELGARLDAIERDRDTAGLATARERRQWADLEALGDRLAGLPEGPDVTEARDKHRLLRGVLLWNLDRDFKARLWRERRSLHELERAVNEAGKRRYRVDAARRAAPAEFDAFVARIAALEPRIEALRGRVTVALEAQHDQLQALAVERLEEQKARLDTYTVQARFALATLYDRAAVAGN